MKIDYRKKEIFYVFQDGFVYFRQQLFLFHYFCLP